MGRADVEGPGAFILPALSMPVGGTFPQELGLRVDVPRARYRVIKDVAIEGLGSVIVSFEFAVV